MGYTSKKGRRPNEYASKSSHGYIINDPDVANFLEKCNLPKFADDITLPEALQFKLEEPPVNPIKHIIAIDGGYSEVFVRQEFPSSTISFFQFGALIFSLADLTEISLKAFIDPADIAKLNNIQRFELVMPTKNIILKDEASLIDSVRKSIFDFFTNTPTDEKFITTLKWFIFQEYDNNPLELYELSSCPSCSHPRIPINRQKLGSDLKMDCPNCKSPIYLTDVFRLHEAIDNELGANGVLGYVATLVEQIVLIHLIRLILQTKPTLLNEIMFVKDGPLAFFGQTANMHKPMRNLANYLLTNHNLYLAGLEKSGQFVEHAEEIEKKLKPGTVLILNNDYIYKYILPSKVDGQQPYASTSYYSGKLIFKSEDGKVYIVTIPTADAKVVLSPKKEDFKNLDVILSNIQKLKCDMYDNALFPVALANKLVSLANHPSSVILEKFAKDSIAR